MNVGKGKRGWPRRPDVCGAPQLPTSPLRRPGHGPGSAAEAENSLGAWVRGRRARAGGRSQGQPPPRPSGWPPRLPRARRSRRPEEREEERSEPSPGALRDRVPGGGGGGSAPADSFRHFQPEKRGLQEVLLVSGKNDT
ncbi:guanine nucleotide-binding protein G(I)/G(S)/G(O) subunit gamma-12 isoform X1 [Crocuta crocuta]